MVYRRGLVAWLVVVLVSVAGFAGDGEAVEAAKSSALAWLALVDGDEAGESWEVAGSLFKSGVTQEKWVGMLEQARGPLGQVTSRELSGAKFSTELPNAPKGEFVVLEYATSFVNRQDAIERVVAMLDEDGEFRVIGYGIQ